MYRDPALTEKPALLDRRGGAYYSEGGGRARRVAPLRRRRGARRRHAQRLDARRPPAGRRRRGARAGGRRRARTRCRRTPLAPELLGLVQHVAAYERLAREAAVTRDPVTARKALLAHPLVGQIDRVDGLVESLLLEAAR